MLGKLIEHVGVFMGKGVRVCAGDYLLCID